MDPSTHNVDQVNDRKEKKQRKIIQQDSSSDSDEEKSTVSDTESESENMDKARKIISKLFPSKYLKNKLSDLEKIKKYKNKNKKIVKKEKEVESEDDNEEESIIDLKRSKKNNINFIFTISDPLYDKYDSEEDSDYDESSVSSSEYEDSDYESDEDEDEDEDESEYEDDDDDDDDDEEMEKKYSLRKRDKSEKDKQLTPEEIVESYEKMKMGLKSLIEKDENNLLFKNNLKELEKQEKEELKMFKKNEKKTRNKNSKNFKKLIKNKHLINDYNYFKKKLSLVEQKKIIKEIESVNKVTNTEKPHRLQLLDSDIPVELKSVALKKIASLRQMEPGQGEYYKVKTWVDTFMQIPFNVNKHLPINFDMGMEKCNDFMENSKHILDNAVYGMNDSKMQIMQLIGQWITNPNATGTSIAIKGPMGTGKTTLVKEGISKILGRDFAFIALGGATDSSFLEGHSYTYEGSTWGKIVDILIKSKSMNPVIYFDELDKISETPKGEEIAGILTHLTDVSQNSMFHDKYFSEIDFDLSKCLFIFSYNDESRVNPILLDRMYKIQTEGYEKKDKLVIVKKYLLPNILKQINFKEDDITFPDETINYIIDNYTSDEKGVRNLKRCLEIICTKLNLYRLMKPGSTLFENESVEKVEFPYEVKSELTRKLIKIKDDKSYILKTMYL
jgi:ATP-dependent Lon protease